MTPRTQHRTDWLTLACRLLPERTRVLPGIKTKPHLPWCAFSLRLGHHNRGWLLLDARWLGVANCRSDRAARSYRLYRSPDRYARVRERCLIPEFNGALFLAVWKEALWARFTTGAPQRLRQMRRAIQHSQASLRSLAKCYGINPKTVAKWKRRTDTADRRTGPKEPGSTVLSIEEEAVIVAFRPYTGAG